MTAGSSLSPLHWVVPLGAAFATGVATTLLWQAAQTKKEDRDNAGAVVEGNDLSLFYGNKEQLCTITKDAKFLPSEVYATLVQDAVVCCVDILLVRKKGHTKQALLVERSTEPAKGFWWLPGGRLLKGETYFDAAKRKAKEETGLSRVKCIQVLGVYNTFFSYSNWDTDQKKGTQTVNPIVLVELESDSKELKLDATSENSKWISLDPKDNELEDKYVRQALLRLRAWNPNYIRYR